MLMIVIIVALVVVGAVALGIGVRRSNPLSEVSKFHEARAMTTSWSNHYQGEPEPMRPPVASREE